MVDSIAELEIDFDDEDVAETEEKVEEAMTLIQSFETSIEQKVKEIAESGIYEEIDVKPHINLEWSFEIVEEDE